MNRSRLTLTILCILVISTFGWGQIQLKLDDMSEPNTYGVYVQACQDLEPSGNTITGSGQVTIVYPSGLSFTNLVSVSGQWQQNASVSSPPEAPGMDYSSVGFVIDNPQIIYQNDEPTLLFTFSLNGSVGGIPYLIDNESDPFTQLPNSQSSNPGNELTALDFGVVPTGIYYYDGNFSSTSVDCETVVIDTTGQIDDTTVVVIDTTGTGNDPGTGTGGDDDAPTVSSIDELAAGGHFTLTPNPTQEWLNVIFKDGAIEQRGALRFWSVNGIALGELDKENQEKMTLNVGALPPGLYFLSFEVDGKVIQRERFLKQ